MINHALGEVLLVDINVLKPYERNRNHHSDKQIDHLIKLIKHHGFRTPLLVCEETNQVIAGNGRLAALKKMGVREVPAIFQKFLNEDERYTFSVSDNAIAMQAELDFKTINIDLQDLGPELDVTVLGLESFEIEPMDKYKEKKKCPHCGKEI